MFGTRRFRAEFVHEAPDSRTSTNGVRAREREEIEVSPAMTRIVPSTAAISKRIDGGLEVPPLLAKA